VTYRAITAVLLKVNVYIDVTVLHWECICLRWLSPYVPSERYVVTSNDSASHPKRLEFAWQWRVWISGYRAYIYIWQAKFLSCKDVCGWDYFWLTNWIKICRHTHTHKHRFSCARTHKLTYALFYSKTDVLEPISWWLLCAAFWKRFRNLILSGLQKGNSSCTDICCLQLKNPQKSKRSWFIHITDLLYGSKSSIAVET
jgi:hypothetical protein